MHFCNPSPVVSFLPEPWGQRRGFSLLLTEGGGTLVFGVLVLGLLVLAGVLVFEAKVFLRCRLEAGGNDGGAERLAAR